MCKECEKIDGIVDNQIKAFEQQLDEAQKKCEEKLAALGDPNTRAVHVAKCEAAIELCREWIKAGYPTDAGEDIRSTEFAVKGKKALKAKIEAMPLEDVLYTAQLLSFFTTGVSLLHRSIAISVAGRAAEAITLTMKAINTPAEKVA